MTCNELRSDYLLHALGVLEDPERAELQAHLARGCENCMAGLREAQQLAFAMGANAEGPEPSSALKKRVLAGAGVESRVRWHWNTAWQAAAAVALIAIAVILFKSRQYDAEIAEVRQQLNQSGAENATMRAALAMLQAPATRTVAFGPGTAGPPGGRVFFNGSTVLLLASNLPAPPPGKAYEMWVIPKGGMPAPAGLFSSTAQGTALHLYTARSQVIQTDTIAVTLEDAAGVNAPTTQPLIAVQL